jgi:hypothetical protein
MKGTEKQSAIAEEVKARRIAEAEAFLADVDGKRAALPEEKRAAGEPAYQTLRKGLESLRSMDVAVDVIALPKYEIRTLLRDLGK